MRVAGGWLSAPRPVHVILSPALPILALLSGNVGGFLPSAAARSLSLAVGVSLLATLLLGRAVHDVRRAALAVSVCTVVFLSQATIAQIGELLHWPMLSPLSLLYSILLSGVILRYLPHIRAWTTFANALTICCTLLVIWPAIALEVRRLQHPAGPSPRVDVSPRTSGSQPPDVYVLVLDGYGSADVLRDYYHFDNSLVPDLRALGFDVPASASSNYGQTAQSLASSLNLEYLPTLLGPEPSPVAARARFADLIARNRTFEILQAAGYRIRAYASEYGVLQPGPANERPHPALYFTDFEYDLYEVTALPMLFALARMPPATLPFAIHRHQIRWTLDRLQHDRPAKDDPPTLVFAHLLIPHPPFSFEADGRARQSLLPANLNDGSDWRARAVGGSESYQSGYASAVHFLNSRVLEIVRSVLGRADGRSTIFYIQGDHGPGSKLVWDSAADTDMKERFGILLAAYFPPRAARSPMPSGITPVNALRILLNESLGSRLGLLEDRSYFSPWDRPLEFDDVTARVR